MVEPRRAAVLVNFWCEFEEAIPRVSSVFSFSVFRFSFFPFSLFPFFHFQVTFVDEIYEAKREMIFLRVKCEGGNDCQN